MDGQRDSGAWLDQLNALYALCFTVVLTFSYYVKQETLGKTSVEPAFNPDRLPLVLLYALYFMLDWATSNAIKSRGLQSWLVLSAQMLSIPALTIVVLAQYGSSRANFVLIGLHALLVAVWDVFFHCRVLREDVASSRRILGGVLAFVRLGLGLSVLLLASIGYTGTILGRPDIADAGQGNYMTMAGLIVLTKGARTWLLAPSLSA